MLVPCMRRWGTTGRRRTRSSLAGRSPRTFAKDIGARCAESSEGKTVIVVDVLDQSHLHGILDRLGDLNIEIESVNPA